MSSRIEEGVAQYLRLSRMHAKDDLSDATLKRGMRALKASMRPEEWTAVKYEAFARQMEQAGWRVER